MYHTCLLQFMVKLYLIDKCMSVGLTLTLSLSTGWMTNAGGNHDSDKLFNL